MRLVNIIELSQSLIWFLKLNTAFQYGKHVQLEKLYIQVKLNDQSYYQLLEMHQWNALCTCFGGSFKNTYELLNLRALKFSPVNKIHIFQCMGTIFCVEFQRVPLKFHTKYLPTLWKMPFLYNVEILRALRFKSSSAFLNAPQALVQLIHSCVPPLLLEWISEAGVRKHMLTYWGWDKITAIFQMTYSKPFSSVKISVLIKI